MPAMKSGAGLRMMTMTMALRSALIVIAAKAGYHG